MESKRELYAIMFTDMQGYTAMMLKDEAKANKLRKRHRTVLKLFHKEFKGKIIQYFGDGTLSIFKSAVHAVECAIEIQRELKQEPEVPLRIGIHLGDIVYNKEGVFGNGVNLASRIESFSVSGAILISEAIFEQIQSQSQLRTTPLGKFRFKNVDRPTEVYAVINTGIVIPKRSELQGKGERIDLDYPNLPKQITSFVGREKEIQEIQDLFQKAKLVTLSGSGGTGKTRLALKVAESLFTQFKDGLFWVSLASSSDASLIGLSIAKALDLIQDPSKDLEDQLIDYLQPKEALLILDNFEHVLEAVPIVRQILNNCPRIKVLVTSRIVLGLQGEWEYHLKPLQVPYKKVYAGIKELLQYHSIVLFVQRAKAVHPNFELTDRNAADVAKVCLRLDGLPLAIELAAARIKLFSPNTLLKRLDHHLDILKADNLDRPERHHTLRQTLSWSYELLSPAEQKLFHRLSIFSGGCYLQAIESVCGKKGLNSLEIVDQIFALVNQSLLNRQEDEIGEPRFYMLETIRAFALEALKREEEFGSIREAHARYFVAKAEETAPHLIGSEPAPWLTMLEEDLDNFRDAINWAFENSNFEVAFRLGIAIWRLWISRGMLTEGVNLANRLLEWHIPEKLSRQRVKIAEALSITFFYTGDYHKALPLCKENLDYWRKTGPEKEIAHNLNHLGHAYINSGAVEKGINCSHEALKIHTKRKDIRGRAVSYNNLGWAYMNIGIPQKAFINFQRSLELRRQCNDDRGSGFALVNQGWAQGALGMKIEALKSIQDGLIILNNNKDKIVFLWGIVLKARLYYEQNEMEKFEELLRDNSDTIFATGLANTLKGWTNLLNGLLANQRGFYQEADDWMYRGIEVFQERKMIYFANQGWHCRSKFALEAGKTELAWSYLKSSLKITRDYNISLGLAENLELAGILFIEYKAYEKALLMLSKAKQMRIELDVPTPPIMESNLKEAWSRLEKELSLVERGDLGGKGSAMSRDQVFKVLKDFD